MAEASIPTGVVIAVCGTTGAAVCTTMAMFGLDVIFLGGGLLGCIVVRVLLPSAKVAWPEVASVTVASVIFAGLVGPLLVPHVVWAVSPDVPVYQAKVVAAAIAGGFPKPFLNGVNRIVRWWSGYMVRFIKAVFKVMKG